MHRPVERLLSPVALMTTLLLLVGLAGSAKARDYYYAPYDVGENNELRLQVGVAGVSSGYYCHYGFYGSCSEAFGYAEFIARGALELNLVRPLALTLGFQVLPNVNGNPSGVYFEPTLDIGASWHRRTSPVRGRLYFGGGLPINDLGQVGAVVRIGGGLGVMVASHLALGGDVVWSFGGISGYFISSLGFMIGPELTF